MKINRKQTIQEAVDSLGYDYKYINPKIVLKNEGPKEGELEFFALDRYATNEEVCAEYEKKGMVPDFFATVQYLKEHPEVLEKKQYIGIPLEGNCYAAFDGWHGGRSVGVDRHDGEWSDGWWFAGLRKSSDSRILSTESTKSLDLEQAVKMCKEAGYQVSKIM